MTNQSRVVWTSQHGQFRIVRHQPWEWARPDFKLERLDGRDAMDVERWTEVEADTAHRALVVALLLCVCPDELVAASEKTA